MRGSLDSLIRRLDRTRDSNDEWPLVASGYPVTVWPGRQTVNSVVFVTKQRGLLGLDMRRLAPEDATIMYCGGFPSSGQLLRLRSERELGAKSVLFIGDLDPVDLAIWMKLATEEATHGLAATYGGIDDLWIRLCVKYAVKSSSMLPWGLPVIRMSPFELKALHELRQLGNSSLISVGERSLSLLDAGYKLELEGASNPVFYKKSFSSALKRMLRRRIAQLVEAEAADV